LVDIIQLILETFSRDINVPDLEHLRIYTVEAYLSGEKLAIISDLHHKKLNNQ